MKISFKQKKKNDLNFKLIKYIYIYIYIYLIIFLL